LTLTDVRIHQVDSTSVTPEDKLCGRQLGTNCFFVAFEQGTVRKFTIFNAHHVEIDHSIKDIWSALICRVSSQLLGELLSS
jgi:hypothetical protein